MTRLEILLRGVVELTMMAFRTMVGIILGGLSNSFITDLNEGLIIAIPIHCYPINTRHNPMIISLYRNGLQES